MGRVVEATASAPGSLMLFGEHAVLRGYPAVVAAVDARLVVAVRPRDDRRVTIVSDQGSHETRLDALEATPASRFVVGVVAHALARGGLACGLDFTIRSAFSATLGLGSSAAVTVAALAALRALVGGETSPEALCRDGVAVVRGVQGLGSGADVAAAVYGGVLRYGAEPVGAERLCPTLPLTVLYSGSKLPTVEVVARVDAQVRHFPRVYAALFEAIGQVAEAAATALAAGRLEEVGALMNQGQGLMAALGVSLPVLEELCTRLRGRPGILGAKISGSGLGDCVIGLGTSAEPWDGVACLDVQLAGEGVMIETTCV